VASPIFVTFNSSTKTLQNYYVKRHMKSTNINAHHRQFQEAAIIISAQKPDLANGSCRHGYSEFRL